MFKLYFYFLRIYINKEIWNQIQFINSYESLNEKYDLEIGEDYYNNKNMNVISKNILEEPTKDIEL
jgi:hypothetical protein